MLRMAHKNFIYNPNPDSCVVLRTKCDSGQQQVLLEAPVQLSQVSADAGETTLNVFILFYYASF